MSEGIFGVDAEDLESIAAVLELGRGEGPDPAPDARPESPVDVRARRLKWFWRAYWPLFASVIAGVPGMSLGPRAGAWLSPIRGVQSMRVVERTDTRLCWDWTFVKLRGGASDRLDAYLDTPGLHGGVAATFDRTTGAPWGVAKYAVAPRPEPYTLTYCTLLPPYVKPTDPARLRQVAWYPGLFGLWRVPVPFPDVVDPAGAVVP